MNIDQNQITLDKFILNEVNTLGFIKSQTSVAKIFPELHLEASHKFNLYKGRHKNYKPTSFDFGCELKMEIEKAKRSLFVEALVQKDYTQTTYALSICDSDIIGKKLIRKFHFDYDPQNSTSKDKRPKYHLQYGGKSTPKLLDNDISAEPLQDWLSVPRLSFYPINLALLLDMIFNEFPSEATIDVIETREWRDMIKHNEDNILKPYFNCINGFLSGNHKSTYLFRDFAYGE